MSKRRRIVKLDRLVAGHTVEPDGALVFSLTPIHGRSFPGGQHLDDPVMVLAPGDAALDAQTLGA